MIYTEERRLIQQQLVEARRDRDRSQGRSSTAYESAIKLISALEIRRAQLRGGPTRTPSKH